MRTALLTWPQDCKQSRFGFFFRVFFSPSGLVLLRSRSGQSILASSGYGYMPCQRTRPGPEATKISSSRSKEQAWRKASTGGSTGSVAYPSQHQQAAASVGQHDPTALRWRLVQLPDPEGTKRRHKAWYGQNLQSVLGASRSQRAVVASLLGPYVPGSPG